MKRSMRLVHKLWIWAGLNFLLLLGFVASAFVLLAGTGTAFAQLQTSDARKTLVQDLQLRIANVWQYSTDAALTRNRDSLDLEGKSNFDAARKNIADLIFSSQLAQDRIRDLRNLQNQLARFWKDSYTLYDAYGVSLQEGNTAMKQWDNEGLVMLKNLDVIVHRYKQENVETFDAFKQNWSGIYAQNALIFLIGVFVNLIGAWMISRNVRKPLALMLGKVQELRSQSLDQIYEINHKSHDEIGRTIEFVNLLIRDLRSKSADLKDISSESRLEAEKADRKMTKVSELLYQISTDMQKVYEARTMTQQVLESYVDSFKDVRKKMSVSIEKIQEQNRMIHQSSGSIQSIGTHMEELNQSSQNLHVNLENLNRSFDDAQALLVKSFDTVQEITNFTQTMGKIAGMIDDVSQKTNLLAMNAAIEASHAGGSGKGFAVVAEEIRRLAETTQKNSQVISQSSKDVAVQLSEASRLNEETRVLFRKLHDDLSTLTISLQTHSDDLLQTSRRAAGMGSQLTELSDSTQNLEETTKSVHLSTAGIETSLTGISDILVSSNTDYNKISRLMIDFEEEVKLLSETIAQQRNKQTLIEAQLASGLQKPDLL